MERYAAALGSNAAATLTVDEKAFRKYRLKLFCGETVDEGTRTPPQEFQLDDAEIDPLLDLLATHMPITPAQIDYAKRALSQLVTWGCRVTVEFPIAENEIGSSYRKDYVTKLLSESGFNVHWNENPLGIAVTARPME